MAKENPFLKAMGQMKPAEEPQAIEESSTADNPLLSLGAAEVETETAEPKEIDLPSGAPTLEELASQDTDEILAIQTRAEVILQRTEKYICAEAEDLRGLLDAVDSAMQQNDTLSGFDLSTMRNHVATIMVTLKAKPEYATILLDEDVGNMVRYARETYEAATLSVEMSAEKTRNKRAATAKKGALSKANAAAMAGAFDALLTGGKFG